MSNTIIYQCALARPMTPDERRVVESCLARSEQVDALARSLPEMILANRSRREGREIKLTKSQLRMIGSAERDAAKAEAEFLDGAAKVLSVHLLLCSALECERDAMGEDEVIFKGGHPEVDALGKPLLDLRSANIAELEEFLSRSKLSNG